MNNEKGEKRRGFYECELCDYITYDKTKYSKHLDTIKHKTRKTNNINNEKGEKREKGEEKKNNSFQNDNNCKITEQYSNYFFCICGKKYKHKSNLCTHKKKCQFINTTTAHQSTPTFTITTANNDTDNMLEAKNTIIQLMKEKSEVQTMLIESLKKQVVLTPLISGNNNTINTNTKNKLNINVFLNEKCKDAMSMNEFIESIDISLQDLLLTKDKGFASGISNIIIKGISKLSPYQRPIHCTDVKRETLYIKNDKWEKDDNNDCIKEAIKSVSAKQFKNIKKYKEAKPNYMVNDSDRDEYLNIVKNTTDNLDGNNDKIIKEICNNVYVKDVSSICDIHIDVLENE